MNILQWIYAFYSWGWIPEYLFHFWLLRIMILYTFLNIYNNIYIRFQVHSIAIWHLCTLKNDHHKSSCNSSPCSWPRYLFCSLSSPLFLYVCAKLLQSCLTLWDPMNYRLPGSSVYGVFQARILEWVAISFSRESSQPRDGTQHLLHLLHWQVDSSAQAPPKKPILTNSILKYRMVISPTYKAVQMWKEN